MFSVRLQRVQLRERVDHGHGVVDEKVEVETDA